MRQQKLKHGLLHTKYVLQLSELAHSTCNIFPLWGVKSSGNFQGLYWLCIQKSRLVVLRWLTIWHADNQNWASYMQGMLGICFLPTYTLPWTFTLPISSPVQNQFSLHFLQEAFLPEFTSLFFFSVNSLTLKSFLKWLFSSSLLLQLELSLPSLKWAGWEQEVSLLSLGFCHFTTLHLGRQAHCTVQWGGKYLSQPLFSNSFHEEQVTIPLPLLTATIMTSPIKKWLTSELASLWTHWPAIQDKHLPGACGAPMSPSLCTRKTNACLFYF